METVCSEPRRGLKNKFTQKINRSSGRRALLLAIEIPFRVRVSVNEEALISANKVRIARETLRPANGHSFVNFNCNLITTDNAAFRLIIRIDERDTSETQRTWRARVSRKRRERRKGVKDGAKGMAEIFHQRGEKLGGAGRYRDTRN